MEELPEVERVTPFEAGKKLHTNAETVRAGLRQGKFNFGVAIQSKKRTFQLYNF